VLCAGKRYLRHTRADNWNRSALRVCWGLAIGGAFASPFWFNGQRNFGKVP
jgi:hypothetical protein